MPLRLYVREREDVTSYFSGIGSKSSLLPGGIDPWPVRPQALPCAIVLHQFRAVLTTAVLLPAQQGAVVGARRDADAPAEEAAEVVGIAEAARRGDLADQGG